MTIKFEIYPAIDLISGQVVRLMQGDPERKIVYRLNPVEAAKRWIEQGARWIHVVNLDGALDSPDSRNLSALREITAAVADASAVQFGGGIRDVESLGAAFDAGISRAIIGTAAAEAPEFLAAAIRTYGAERIAVGLDARLGIVKTHGWAADTGLSVKEFGLQLKNYGVRTIIYTDIARDGMGTGVDWAGAKDLADVGFEVIASGGAASIEDVHRVRNAELAGVIIGKALYDGRIVLSDAIDAALRVD